MSGYGQSPYGEFQYGTGFGESIEIGSDTGFPEITNHDPADGATDVLVNRGIAFRIKDDVNVVLPKTLIYIGDDLIYDGETNSWVENYSESSYSANSFNGYDFFVVNSDNWGNGKDVEITVVAEDTVANQTRETWTFTTTGQAFPFSLNRFVPKSIRKLDTQSPGILEKLFGHEGGLNDTWEQRIIDRQIELQNTLYNPNKIDAKWLPYLKSKVGFTRDLTFQATEDELRGIITNAVTYWNQKPSESAINSAIRMLTGNRFRVRNYFDFRMQAGASYVTEVLENFDPNALSFVSEIPYGDQLIMTGINTFTIGDLPITLFPNGLFNNLSSTYLWLQVTSWPDDTSLQKTYAIDALYPGTPNGLLKTTNSLYSPGGTNQGSWRLIGANSEYITEVRLVDELTGIGAVNHTLLELLMDQVRPSGERVDVIYLAFLEEFDSPGNLLQWTQVGTPTVPEPGGVCYLDPGDDMLTEVTGSATWGRQSILYKISGEATTQLRLKFLQQDSNDYYFILVDFAQQEISLYKMVSATPTQIGSTISMGALLQPNVEDVIRVDIDTTLTGVQIRVRYNNEIILVETDTTFTAGTVGVESVLGGDVGYIHMIEVMTLPVTVSRVGPNP